MRSSGRPWIRNALLAAAGAIVLPFVWELLLEAKWGAGALHEDISPSAREELRSTALQALRSGDVPVGAILMFGDSVIGRGFNTVLAGGEAGGHAEINALSDAMKRHGVARFDRLNRDSLLLVSTYEPCMMCMGALMEARIRHIRFLKAKPLFARLREDARLFLTTFRMERRDPSELQDSLFRLHTPPR